MSNNRGEVIDRAASVPGPAFSPDREVLRIAFLALHVAMIALGCLAFATVVDVIGRNTPAGFTVRGIYEVSGLVMAVIIAAAAAPAFLLRRNVGMELLVPLLGERSLLTAVASIAETAFLLLLAWRLHAKAADALEFQDTTSLLGLSIAPFWFAASYCLFFAGTATLWKTGGHLLALRKTDPRRLLRPALILTLIGAAVAGILASLVAADATPGWQAGAAFLALYLLIVAGIPIGISLGLTGFGFLYLVIGEPQALAIVENETARALSSDSLAAIPLFLLMGSLAVQAGLAGDIFKAASRFTAGFRGGLSIASVIGCGAFGAISGSSIATTATFGKVAFSEMKQRGYDSGLATGTLAAGGTLGALIPPSVVLIIYCVLVEVSIQEAFIASLIPGLLAMGLYLVAVVVQVRLRPDLAPQAEGFDAREAMRSMAVAWRPILLFLMVLGGLYGGVFTTQEAAAVGAVLAFAFAVTSKGFSLRALLDGFAETAVNTVVIYVIVIGANIFAAYLTLTDITTSVLSVVDLETTPHWLILLVIMAMYLVLGSVFDTVAAVLVTAPFVIPLISGMGYDLIWWGVITLSLVEIGMITPPIGVNVFVMKSVIGTAAPIKTIFKGIVPFLAADLIRLAVLTLFPILTLWLPKVL
ncbi:TRAP transporter large permease [Stappia indica]|uniref:TRAP transporter large permease n=1 Tax=Stappia indica TaxID=538381 RepID=UPI001CD63480|nr:TRAP transporter large permease [Stappia indica]MCA1300543.1 TRAP transporter large permease [Stappia indica]